MVAFGIPPMPQHSDDPVRAVGCARDIRGARIVFVHPLVQNWVVVDLFKYSIANGSSAYLTS